MQRLQRLSIFFFSPLEYRKLWHPFFGKALSIDSDVCVCVFGYDCELHEIMRRTANGLTF